MKGEEARQRGGFLEEAAAALLSSWYFRRRKHEMGPCGFHPVTVQLSSDRRGRGPKRRVSRLDFLALDRFPEGSLLVGRGWWEEGGGGGRSFSWLLPRTLPLAGPVTCTWDVLPTLAKTW